MSGQIPESFIDSLLDRIDLVELIGNRIPLKKSGTRYSALCPFHQEKTPSFSIKRGDRYYHCFGCGAHGDAISFLREYENKRFVEAVEELARIANIEVPRNPAEREQAYRRKTLLDAVEYAANYYEKQLANATLNTVAVEYLQKRGVTPHSIEHFRLGFAPPFQDGLTRAASADLIPLLTECRLIGENEGRRFDLFRNRLMFPIRNIRGQVVAFGGRTLGDDKAKYINSPESEVFHKSHEIYGLYEAQRANRHLTRLIVAEGYMDVVSLHQAGITEAVAMLGTATNQENLRAALKACPNLLFCFDGDNAGRRAAEKAMINMLELLNDGITAEFLFLPEGDDPDSLVQRDGAAGFQKLLVSAVPLSRQLLNQCAEGLDLMVAEQQGVFRSRLDPLVARIPSRTIQRALQDAAFQRIREQRFRSDRRGGQKPLHEAVIPTPSLLGLRDKVLIKGLYFQPDLAPEVLRHTDDEPELKGARSFASYIALHQLTNTTSLLRKIACDHEAYRAFHHFIDTGDIILSPEACITEANDLLARLRQKKLKTQR